MSNVSIVLARVDGSGRSGRPRHAGSGPDGALVQAPRSVPDSTDLMTAGASAKSALTAPSDPTAYCWFITTKVDIWVKFGDDPTAVAGEDWLVLAGTTRAFYASSPAEEVAILAA